MADLAFILPTLPYAHSLHASRLSFYKPFLARPSSHSRAALPRAGARGSVRMVDMPSQRTPQELAALYGGAYLGTSMALSLLSFLMWYAAVSVGVDVPLLLHALGDWLETTPLGRPSALDSISGEVGTFALAYVAHKVTSPFRFPLTVAATPVVAKLVGRRGFKKRKRADDERGGL